MLVSSSTSWCHINHNQKNHHNLHNHPTNNQHQLKHYNPIYNYDHKHKQHNKHTQTITTTTTNQQRNSYNYIHTHKNNLKLLNQELNHYNHIHNNNNNNKHIHIHKNNHKNRNQELNPYNHNHNPKTGHDYVKRFILPLVLLLLFLPLTFTFEEPGGGGVLKVEGVVLLEKGGYVCVNSSAHDTNSSTHNTNSSAHDTKSSTHDANSSTHDTYPTKDYGLKEVHEGESPNPYNFSVCLFLRLPEPQPGPQGQTDFVSFFHYQTNSTYLIAGVTSDRKTSEKKLSVTTSVTSNYIHTFNTTLETNVWYPICFGFNTQYNESWLVLDGQAFYPNLVWPYSFHKGVEGICLGSPISTGKQLNGWVAGVSVRAGLEILSHPASASCSSLVSWSNHNPIIWNDHKTILKGHYLENELCSHSHHHFWIDTPGNYSNTHRHCQAMGGRLPVSYTDLIPTSPPRCSSQIPNTSWITGGHPTSSLYDLSLASCPVLVNGTMDSYLCFTEIHCSQCIAPAWLRYTLYGLVYGHDHHYFLTNSSEGNIYFQGLHQISTISRVNGSWMLQSQSHSQEWKLKGGTWPVGRRQWQSGTTITNLTFTTCTPFQFSDHDGLCMPLIYRCDGKLNAVDASDEFDCLKRQVQSVSHEKPLTDKGKKMEVTITSCFVDYIEISSKTLDATKLKITITLKWTDYGNYFRDWNRDHYFTCKEFWHPKLLITNQNSKRGEINRHPPLKHCDVYKDNTEYMDIKDNLMGRIVDGQNTTTYMTFVTDLTFACNFSLQLFPFGTHSCSVLFMINEIPEKMLNVDTKISYYGNSDLKEYKLVKITFENTNETDKLTANLTLVVSSQYGYHILTSFIPTFLMLITAYLTLFFPVTAFNERIVASITAVLVLAALFTQASSNYVYTAYHKLIDLWYTFTILYCFIVFICNVLINYLLRGPTKSKSPSCFPFGVAGKYILKSAKPDTQVPMIEDTNVNRIAARFNIVCIILMFLKLVAVTSTFYLYAMEKI